ncbi:unnamed protein product, partial [Effrenium voratum]
MAMTGEGTSWSALSLARSRKKIISGLINQEKHAAANTIKPKNGVGECGESDLQKRFTGEGPRIISVTKSGVAYHRSELCPYFRQGHRLNQCMKCQGYEGEFQSYPWCMHMNRVIDQRLISDRV